MRLDMLIEASILGANDLCSVLSLSSKDFGFAYFVTRTSCSTSALFCYCSSCRRERTLSRDREMKGRSMEVENRLKGYKDVAPNRSSLCRSEVASCDGCLMLAG